MEITSPLRDGSGHEPAGCKGRGFAGDGPPGDGPQCPESDPPEHVFGSMPILRCSELKPCPDGFVCAKYGTSALEEALCIPYSEPCWSTADCSPGDMCDKADEEFSLTGICRPRERPALGLFE